MSVTAIPHARAKIAIQPVQVTVISHTPQLDVEEDEEDPASLRHESNGDLPRAVQVRLPERLSLRTLMGSLPMPGPPGRVRPDLPSAASFQLSPRENILMEGYRIARIIR
jgi:hypothetical protein